MQPAIVVHHHEITLKGENRRLFERQLMKNVRNSLSGLVPASSIHGGYGRFIVELGADEEIGTLVYALTEFDCSKHLFDIAHLYLTGNFEVKNHTTKVLNHTIFKLKINELQKVKRLLKKYGITLSNFKIEYSLLEY